MVRPSRSRSAATRPPTVTTIGDSRSRRAGVVPAIVSALRRPSRNGATQRSSSSVRSGRPNVSATGPGPSTGPLARAPSPIAVIGRLWSITTPPSDSMAHSMSWAAPNVDDARRASLTSLRRVRRARNASGTSALASRSRPRADERHVHAVDLTAHEAVRTAGHGGDHEAVGAAGDRIGTEQHAAPCRLEERLHENGDRSLTAGADDLVDRIQEALPTANVQHRREQTRHRLRATVLDRR